ncbi:Alcohol dehydrogenase superfamily, zinc-containing [Candidatus Burkholderia pumila]|uniref:Alcohol dehydrogenase superfamily, zinc-containing n=1 Tax=Candidatus Burkholderia pumila TaxID=1090375 RepID=A0ABR5HK99_9BURK|nr:Alcohol dehydrogenase superfamily, zinc-containing [Candidatus Burkholderia pumila]
MNMVTEPAFKQASFTIPSTMQAWVLGDPNQLSFADKPVPQPGPAEMLVRIDAIAVCATDLEIIHRGPLAQIQGGLPFNKNFTPDHEYMGPVVKLGPGVDEYRIGDRVVVEVHAGCGRCERCREGMYTSCLNYDDMNTRDTARTASRRTAASRNTPSTTSTRSCTFPMMSDEEVTLIVTAGMAMYGLDVTAGLIAGQSVVVMGPGPIGLMDVGVAKALGASEVILTGTRDNRLEMGRRLGADHTINVRNEDAVEKVREYTHSGAHYVLECSGAPNAVTDAALMLRRGGRICLAAFPSEPVPIDVAALVHNNIYLYGIRGEGKSATQRAAELMKQKRFDAKLIHTHIFPLKDVPEALRYARERIDDGRFPAHAARAQCATRVDAPYRWPRDRTAHASRGVHHAAGKDTSGKGDVECLMRRPRCCA